MDERPQHDGFGRDINYLRIAVTDKCNFRCIYCMPADGVAPRAHDELLSAEEIARFVRLVAGEGIRRVRLTGGEPLVSRRIIPLIRDIRAIPQIEDISLTTNGALLPKLAPQLKDAGLDRVNISLDTLDPALFGKITRLGRLEQTMAGIDAALAWGFEPVKVNCVVVRRLNQDAAALARLTVGRPIHLRFIEYMPIGDEHTSSHCAVDPHAPTLNPELWDASDTVPSDELRARINAGAAAAGLGELEPLDINDAPAGAVPRATGAFRARRARSASLALCPTIFRELQPSASDGRTAAYAPACSAMPSIRCARRCAVVMICRYFRFGAMPWPTNRRNTR
ncbi:MAG: GTP 3',8-cyclase MoaA [Collinsella sp.]